MNANNFSFSEEKFNQDTDAAFKELKIGNLKNSIKVFKKIVETAQNAKQRYFESLALKNLGTALYRIGELEESLNKYLKSEQIASKYNFQEVIPAIRNHVANIYFHKLELKKAKIEVEEGLKKIKDLKSKNREKPWQSMETYFQRLKLSQSLVNIAQGDFNHEKIEFQNRIITYQKKLNSMQDVEIQNNKEQYDNYKSYIDSLNILGNIYLQEFIQNKKKNRILLSKAENCFQKSKNLALNKLKEKHTEYYSNFKLAEIKFIQKQIKKGFKILKKYDDPKLENMRDKIKLHLMLADVYSLDIDKTSETLQHLNKIEKFFFKDEMTYGKVQYLLFFVRWNLRASNFRITGKILDQILVSIDKLEESPNYYKNVYFGEKEKLKTLLEDINDYLQQKKPNDEFYDLNQAKFFFKQLMNYDIFFHLDEFKRIETSTQREFIKQFSKQFLHSFQMNESRPISFIDYHLRWENVYLKKYLFLPDYIINDLVYIQYFIEYIKTYNAPLLRLAQIIENVLKEYIMNYISKKYHEKIQNNQSFPLTFKGSQPEYLKIFIDTMTSNDDSNYQYLRFTILEHFLSYLSDYQDKYSVHWNSLIDFIKRDILTDKMIDLCKELSKLLRNKNLDNNLSLRKLRNKIVHRNENIIIDEDIFNIYFDKLVQNPHDFIETNSILKRMSLFDR